MSNEERNALLFDHKDDDHKDDQKDDVYLKSDEYKSEGFQQALSLMDQNNISSAIELFKFELEKTGTDQIQHIANINYQIGLCYSREGGDDVAAIFYFNEVIKIYPTFNHVYYDRASAYYALKQYDKVIADTEVVRKHEAKDSRLYYKSDNLYRLAHCGKMDCAIL